MSMLSVYHVFLLFSLTLSLELCINLDWKANLLHFSKDNMSRDAAGDKVGTAVSRAVNTAAFPSESRANFPNIIIPTILVRAVTVTRGDRASRSPAQLDFEFLILSLVQFVCVKLVAFASSTYRGLGSCAGCRTGKG